MTRIERSALVPYSAPQMYDIVNRVDQYPAFLPWCEDAEIHNETATSMEATLTLARGGLRQSFTTRNTLEPDAAITLQLVRGPFSSLTGHWSFTPLGEDGSKVLMVLDFSIENRLLKQTLGKVFSQVADRLVDAFSQRAEALYGSHAGR